MKEKRNAKRSAVILGEPILTGDEEMRYIKHVLESVKIVCLIHVLDWRRHFALFEV